MKPFPINILKYFDSFQLFKAFMIKLRINLEKHGESVRPVSVKQYKLLHVCSIYCMLFMKKKPYSYQSKIVNGIIVKKSFGAP